MVAGGIPTIQVLLDDGIGAFPYDISSKVRVGYVVKRGRQDELAAVTPGDLTLVLDNNDGRFTLGSTTIASPSPIKVDQRIRVKVTANAVVTTRFTGYVQQWPVAWPSGSDLESLVQVTATDAQARGERQILRSVIEQEILPDAPAALYTLGEPSTATSAADSSGNQAPSLVQLGTGTAVTFGSGTGPGTDGLTAATFAGGCYLSTNRNQLAGTGALGAECWFSTTSTPAAGTAMVLLRVGFTGIGVFPDGKLHTSAALDLSSPVVTDGATHYVSWQSGHVYLDGADLGVPTQAPVGNLLEVGGSSNYGLLFASISTTPVPWIGTIAHVVANAATLSSARSLAHSQAGSTGFAGESGTARMTRTAGYASLPVGTLDTSLTNVGFSDITGKSASEALRQVADAEFGLLYFDGSGNLTFHNRTRVVTKLSPDLTLTADVLDPGTAFVVDMQGVLNYYQVTATGTNVTQLARSTTSEATHGRYPGSATYMVQTDREALDRGNWIIYTHAEPLARVGSLVLDVMVLDPATQASLLACEPDTWLRITGLPSQAPGGTTADFIVQGFADTVTNDSWSVAFNVANKAVTAPTPWILGDATYSVLGSTTRLYV